MLENIFSDCKHFENSKEIIVIFIYLFYVKFYENMHDTKKLDHTVKLNLIV